MYSILITEDDPQSAELLTAYLEDFDATITVAQDGADAWEKIQEHPPDLILLDIMMPRMSGFQLCRKLKWNVTTRHIPVMMVTALTEAGDNDTARESGADEFISKPVSRIEFMARVKRLLNLS